MSKYFNKKKKNEKLQIIKINYIFINFMIMKAVFRNKSGSIFFFKKKILDRKNNKQN